MLIVVKRTLYWSLCTLKPSDTVQKYVIVGGEANYSRKVSLYSVSKGYLEMHNNACTEAMVEGMRCYSLVGGVFGSPLA